MCLGLFLRNRKVELESSRIWLASVWTTTSGRAGYLQGRWKRDKELWPCYRETQVLHRGQAQQKLAVEPLLLQLRQKWLLFPTVPHIWMFRPSQTCLCGTPLHQQGLLKDTDRGDVSEKHLTDPVAPRPPPTWCLELASWKKALMHSPVSIWTQPWHSPTLLTSFIPFTLPFHHTPIVISPWMERIHLFDTHIQTLKWTSWLPDHWLYLVVPEKVDYSLSNHGKKHNLCHSENRTLQTLGFPFPSPYNLEWLSERVSLQRL